MIRKLTRRPGITLIELMVVISMMSIFLGALGSAFWLSWRADKSSRNHRSQINDLLRLENQFRRDLHAASSVELTEANPGMSKLLVVLPEGKKAEYSIDESSVMRLQSEGDRTLQRESYRLPKGAQPQWQIQAGEGTTLVSFTLRKGNESEREGLEAGKALFPAVQIDAVLGLSPGMVEIRKSAP